MSKRTIALLLTVLMVCSLLVPVASATESTPTAEPENIMATYYVSPNGSDSNSGESADQPFATLEKVQEAVRAAKKDGMTGDIVVYLMDGTWELSETLTFGKEDSGTNGHNIWYKAYGNATPTISGGTKLTGQWTQTTLENGKTAYTIPLDRDTKLRALYVNGERRYMAHTENAIPAQGSWGSYIIGNVPELDDYMWTEVYSEDFENCDLQASSSKIEPYAKSGDTSKAVLSIAETEDNKALQIAHTANEDCGFQIPEVTYQNALITYRVQFAMEHKFTHQYEALHMHGANKLVDDEGRTAWAGIKLAPHLNQTYFQYGSSGGSQGDDATQQLNTTAFTAEAGTWYQIKMMVTADGYYYTKIWKDGKTEPTDWSRRETFNNLNDENKFLRIYAYKNNNNSKMDIWVDDIQIQSGTLIAEGGETVLPDWAWTTGSKFDGILYYQSDLPEITRNIEDVEIENQQTWNKNTVCVREIEPGQDGKWILKLQQPYGAIAQTPGWGVGLQGTGSHIIYNAYELLDNPGEFYFDRAAKTLYYIPVAGEDMSEAAVVVPRLETVVEFKGTPTVTGEMDKVGADNKTITGQVKNIIFDGISVAHSDWLLQKVDDSYGKSTVQAGTVYTAYASNNWHVDMYRNLDTIPGAVEMEFAHNIRFLNGEIKLTGAEGVLLSNDVDGCEVTGNFIYQTGGGGVVVGNPHHIYENDALEQDVYYYHMREENQPPYGNQDGAPAGKEKYQNGTERVPRDVTISNNYLLENCRLFPSHCPITSFFTQNMEVSNNFIKDAAYSGMSIGWGWCNFDGETNGDRWGTENNQGYAILPGIPTNTCFGNRIVNNRIDTVMTILHDGGLIYTLGKQEDTEISGNFVINSQNHGIYQDEGSAYFKPIANNVIANVPASGWSKVIFAPAYGRKHDLSYKNNYSNLSSERVEVTAPNSTCQDFHYISDSVWPKEASDIIQNSGLTAEYRAAFAAKLAAAYGSVQDALMPQKAGLKTGESLTLNAWLDASDEIWLAPASTTSFTEGTTMKKVPGNAASISTAGLADGTYYIYVKQDGAFSAASQAAVTLSCENPQTVTFASGEGSGSMAAVTVSAGVAYELPVCSFAAPAGMHFAAWQVNGEEKQPGDLVTVTENMTVTALWTADHTHSYTMQSDADGHWLACSCDETQKKEAHTGVLKGYVAPTRWENGYSGDTVCSVCDYLMEEGHTLPKTSGGIHVEHEAPDEKPETPVVDTDFADVRRSDWYYDAVAYVAENGIMTGVAEGVFNPEGAVTRAMVWTVLARMDGVNTEGGSTWYTKAQRWAMETGVSDGTDPMGSITREQLAAMLYRFEGSPAVNGTLSAYPDAASVSDWAKDAMIWATETGLINGINGSLKPQDGATRAQLATLLMRMF